MIRSLIVAVALFAAFFLVSVLGAPSRSVARPALSPAAVHPKPARPGVIPNALPVRLSTSQLATAARRCAAWAAKAGFPNTSLGHGRLTTAVAVALAETGCDPAACYNNSTRRACTEPPTQPATQPTSQPTTRPTGRPTTQPTARASTRGGRQHGGDSLFRGAWQVGGQSRTGVSDTCAYQGRCNGQAAYRVVAGYGTDLRPWTAYLTGHYQRYLAAARARGQRPAPGGAAQRGDRAVRGVRDRPARRLDLAGPLRAGLAQRGVDAVRPAAADRQRTLPDRRAPPARPAAASTGGTARPGPVSVASCTGSSFQDWRPGTEFALTNVGARLCLTAPGSPAPPGTTLTVQPCAGRRGQRWFRP